MPNRARAQPPKEENVANPANACIPTPWADARAPRPTRHDGKPADLMFD